MLTLLLALASLAPQRANAVPPTPPPPRVASIEHVQVHDVPIGEANKHPGKIISLSFTDGDILDLQGVTEPAGVVVEGEGRSVKRILFSPFSSATYVYDLTITNNPGAKAAVTCEPQPGVLDGFDDPGITYPEVGFTYFQDCLFGRGQGYWNVADLEGIPGLVDGRVAAKWWCSFKAPRKWYFNGCTFHASQEHGLYDHGAHEIRIENCLFYADGGCAIQIVQRYGRPGTGAYYGNPRVNPPQRGDCIIRRNRFIDATIWGREASTITVVGWVQGDVYIRDAQVEGSVGAVAVWIDAYKGAYSRTPNGATYAFVPDLDGYGDIQVGPGAEVLPVRDRQLLLGRPYNMVVLDNIEVQAGPQHNREQVMVSGFPVGIFRDVHVNSHKPGLVIGAKAGGPWLEGRVHLRGSWTENEYPWFFEDDRRALSSSDNYEPPFAYVRATPRTKPDWFEGARLR